ncbi:MAG: hypothetical protein IKT44_03345 [Clostridia bacterium]|nr:hypothetical protein [Clostridia bacterium]
MKQVRQKAILDIISNKVIVTQEDLQNELQNLGFDVTQSTVSRDIKDMKLIKTHDSEGNYRYASNIRETVEKSHTRDIFVKSVLSVDYALNNVVIKCRTGLASGACVALDEMFHDLMLGSLAGDDTIIVVTSCTEDSKRLTQEIKNIL